MAGACYKGFCRQTGSCASCVHGALVNIGLVDGLIMVYHSAAEYGAGVYLI